MGTGSTFCKGWNYTYTKKALVWVRTQGRLTPVSDDSCFVSCSELSPTPRQDPDKKKFQGHKAPICSLFLRAAGHDGPIRPQAENAREEACASGQLWFFFPFAIQVLRDNEPIIDGLMIS